MEIRQLRYYIFAAKTLNFTEAAQLSNCLLYTSDAADE